MRKLLFQILCGTLLISGIGFWSVHAQNSASFILEDEADLFSGPQEEALMEMGRQIAQEYEITIFILTGNESNSYNPNNYAMGMVETFGEEYLSSGYVGYAVNMKDRSYYIGYDTTQKDFVLDTSDSQAVSQAAYEALSQGEYYQSAVNMLSQTKKQLALATSSFPALTKITNDPASLIWLIAFPLLGALILSLLLTLFKLQKHKEKNEKHEANDYMKAPRASLAGRRLIHVYETRAPKPKQQDSHGGSSFSSGGSNHGGSGGHF